MSEPTGVLGFRNFLLRVAEKAGMAYYGSDGQGKAIVPVDAYNLDKCKRIINDAFRLFDGSPPPQGWHWKERITDIVLAATATGTATGGSTTTLVDTTSRDEDDDHFNDWLLTITAGTGISETAIITDFDNGTSTLTFAALSGGSTPDTTSIYRVEKINLMPEDFDGQIAGKVTYTAASNHATPLSIVDESTIRQFRANFISTGYVTKIAFVPYRPPAGTLNTSRRWEMKTDPSPSVNDTLKVPYISHFNAMDCETGTADSGSPTTLVDGDRLEADDYFNGWILTVIAGTGLGQTATITDDYAGSTGTFSFTALSGGSTPDTTTVYYVEPAANLHPAGFRFDNHVLAACYAEAEKQIEEINEGAVELFYKVNLGQAHQIDNLSRPRRLLGRRNSRGYYPQKTWLNVTTDNDM